MTVEIVTVNRKQEVLDTGLSVTSDRNINVLIDRRWKNGIRTKDHGRFHSASIDSDTLSLRRQATIGDLLRKLRGKEVEGVDEPVTLRGQQINEQEVVLRSSPLYRTLFQWSPTTR